MTPSSRTVPALVGLVLVAVLTLVPTLVPPPAGAAGAAGSAIVIDPVPGRVSAGGGVGFNVSLRGRAGERRVWLQRLEGRRWVTVERGRASSYAYLRATAPRRPGRVTWRVVAPPTRARGRVWPRLVSRTVVQRVVTQRVVWRMPRAARIGTRVTPVVRFLPYLRGQSLAIQQEVNGRWQYVSSSGVGRLGARPSFTQVTAGPSRFRLRGPDGRFRYRSLRGTPGPVLATRRLSVTANGSQLSSGTYDAAASDDGRWLAFSTYADNAVRGDTNDKEDVFLKDTVTGAVRRVSHGPGGREPGGSSVQPAISGDGRVVAFVSRAANLVPGDRNGTADVFAWERGSGEVTRVGTAASEPAVSSDGRFVAFTARTAQGPRVVVRDRSAGTSRTLGPGSAPSISADGALVAYATAGQVELWDRATGASTAVVAGGRPQLSADGAVLAYVARAAGHAQVFRRDLASGSSTLLSQRDGVAGGADSRVAALSADGSSVLLTSDAPLTADDVDSTDDEACQSESECYSDLNLSDAYVVDAAGAVSLVSRSATGEVSDYEAYGLDLLGDGSAVVFGSRDVLVPGQSTRDPYYSSVHAYPEVFVRDLD